MLNSFIDKKFKELLTGKGRRPSHYMGSSTHTCLHVHVRSYMHMPVEASRRLPACRRDSSMRPHFDSYIDQLLKQVWLAVTYKHYYTSGRSTHVLILLVAFALLPNLLVLLQGWFATVFLFCVTDVRSY